MNIFFAAQPYSILPTDRFAMHPDDRRELHEFPAQQVGLPRRGPEPPGDRDQPVRIAAMAPRMQAFGKQVESREDSADAGEQPAVWFCGYQEAVRILMK